MRRDARSSCKGAQNISALALVWMLGVAVSAAGQWQSAYEGGIQAVKRKDWAAAEALLLKAKGDSAAPAPGRSVVYSGRTRKPFLPDLYLAIVYRNTNRASQALRLFRVVEASGFVGRTDPEWAEFVREKELAEQVVNAEAKQLRDRFERLLATSDGHLKAGHYEQARDTLSEARTLGVETARVDELAGEVDKAEREAAIQRRNTNVAALDEQIQTALKSKSYQEAGRLADALQELHPDHPQLLRYRSRTARLRRLHYETRAVAAFLSGKYSDAIQIAEDTLRDDTRSPRLELYLASSYAAMGLLASEKREADASTQLARRHYKSIDDLATERADFDLDWQLISPRIRAVLEER